MNMLDPIETYGLHRRRLFAGGVIAALLAPFQAGAVPAARSGQAMGAVTSESRLPFDSASGADDWSDFDKSG
jgi:hypothetical protein